MIVQFRAEPKDRITTSQSANLPTAIAKGGVAGVLLAIWAAQLLSRLLASLPLPVPERLSIVASPDLSVLAVSLSVILATGLLFALVPALQAARSELVPRSETAGVRARYAAPGAGACSLQRRSH